MKLKFAKLLIESECLCLIKGKHTEDELIDVYLKANLQSLYKVIADAILQAKLLKPHYYRFKIQVHAQEIEDGLLK